MDAQPSFSVSGWKSKLLALHQADGLGFEFNSELDEVLDRCLIVATPPGPTRTQSSTQTQQGARHSKYWTKPFSSCALLQKAIDATRICESESK
jgi:hypothetical protein